MMLFYKAFANIRSVRKSHLYKENSDIRILGDGLWVSVLAFMAGAFFASTEYSMYPYYLVAYTTALYQIACVPSAGKHKIDRLASIKTGMDRDVSIVYASQDARIENGNSSAGKGKKILGWGYKWNSPTNS